MSGLIYLTGTSGTAADERDQAQTRATVAETERDEVAQDVQNVAGPVAALCTAGGAPAAALESAGLCGVAREALVSPIVTRVTEGLTPAQIDDIVARVLALAPPPQSTDAVVAAVLAQLRADPALAGGLTEAQVRGIVLAVMAENPPRAGRDGVDGTSFGGLTFVRQNGQCVALVTLVRPDGSITTRTSTVGSAACEDAPPPPPPPPPPPTTEPPPPPTTEPPPPVEPEPAPAPTQPPAAPQEAPSPPPDQGGDALPGVIG